MLANYLDRYMDKILDFTMSIEAQQSFATWHPYLVTFAISLVIFGSLFKLQTKVGKAYLFTEMLFVVLSMLSGYSLSKDISSSAIPSDALSTLNNHSTAATITITIYLIYLFVYALESSISKVDLKKQSEALFVVVALGMLYLFYSGKSLVFKYGVAVLG